MMKSMGKKAIALIVLLAGTMSTSFAQIGTGQLNGQVNAVFSAIPLLRVNPDGRTGGMGEVGIATEVDAAAIYHNTAKMAFSEQDISTTFTLTPWLRDLVPDIYLGYLSAYGKLDDLQSIGGSIRYFSLGNIQFTNMQGDDNGSFNPNEFAIDLAYARKLSARSALGINLKYVRSDLASGQSVDNGNLIRAAQAIAADISYQYRNNEIELNGKPSTLAFGATVSNIGNKVSYTEDDIRDFIPVNLGIGGALTTQFDEHNSLMFSADINKLLVPTPDPANPTAHREKSLLQGIFGSFSDAPGGFKEELRELMYSVGVEYWYNKQFAVRAGYFNEHATKGNRKYLTAGLGFRYSVFSINLAYVAPVSAQRHPLDNTLRFSLSFDFYKDQNTSE